jgi:hypothetical protein
LDDQTPGNTQKDKAVHRLTTVKDGGRRPGNGAKPALGISRRYKVNSCSRPIPLGYRPKRYAKSAFAAPARQALP